MREWYHIMRRRVVGRSRGSRAGTSLRLEKVISQCWARDEGVETERDRHTDTHSHTEKQRNTNDLAPNHSRPEWGACGWARVYSLAEDSPGPEVAWKRPFRQDRDDSSMGLMTRGHPSHTDVYMSARGWSDAHDHNEAEF